MLFVLTEVGATVLDEHVKFFETTLVEQHVDAFTRRVLAFFMLLGNGLFATTQPSLDAKIN